MDAFLVTTVYIFCCSHCLLLYFSQQVWNFGDSVHVFKVFFSVLDLWEVCVSEVLVTAASGEKVQLNLHLVLCAVGEEPGLSVAAFVDGEAMLTESLHGQ